MRRAVTTAVRLVFTPLSTTATERMKGEIGRERGRVVRERGRVERREGEERKQGGVMRGCTSMHTSQEWNVQILFACAVYYIYITFSFYQQEFMYMYIHEYIIEPQLP